MPISRDEFEKGETENSVKAKIRGLLQRNPDKAFSFDEIVEHLFKSEDPFGSLSHENIVEEALKGLLDDGQIISKVVYTESGKKVYFTWKT